MAFEKELLEGVYFLKGPLPSGSDVNSVILASEGEAVFFDFLYYPKDTLRMIEIADAEELDALLDLSKAAYFALGTARRSSN